MAKQTRRILSSTSKITFDNGTTLGVAPFIGEATQWSHERGGTRGFQYPAEEDTSAAFRAGLEDCGIVEQETIHLAVTAPASRRSYRAAPRNDNVVLTPAPPIIEGLQVVLYQDESGGLSWHFPDTFFAASRGVAGDGLRASRRAKFTIPTRTVAAEQSAGGNRKAALRGPITKFGRKIFKVLVVPLLSDLLADPVQKIVAATEQKHARNLLHRIHPDNYLAKDAEPFREWDRLAGKRSLLVVHGLMTSTSGMLAGLPRPAMEELVRCYEGRVLAFDHFTLSSSPWQNAELFLQQATQGLAGARAEFDILCHSRGGIVARSMVELGDKIVPGHTCNFGKVFMVAVPNQGSILANPEHTVEMLDVFTNLLTNFPDGPTIYAVEILLAIVKLLAYTAEKHVPGLAALGTEGFIKTTLNQQSVKAPAYYAAAAADYDPDPQADNAFFAAPFNAVIDQIFSIDGAPQENDLVVPCQGVFAANGHPSFPIADPLVFKAADHVWHTAFLSQNRTVQRMLAHFGAVRATASAKPPEHRMATEEPQLLGVPQQEPAPKLDTFRGIRRRSGVVAKRENWGGARGAAAAASPALSAGAMPAEGAAKPKTQLEREPKINFHEQVKAEVENELVVHLDELTAAHPGVSSVLVPIARGEESVRLSVVLSAAGFDVRPESADMTVKRERDPNTEKVSFWLTARPVTEATRRVIHADFFLGNTCIGGVSHATVVIPRGAVGGPADGRSWTKGFCIPNATREDCDWALIITTEGQAYDILLRSCIPVHAYGGKQVGKLVLQEPDLAGYLDSFLNELFDRYPDETLPQKEFADAVKQWQEEFMFKIQAVGKRLWTWLPEGLRQEYFALYAANQLPRSILIHSDEMIFPWEIVIPHEMVNGKLVVLPALGLAHVLGRWKPSLTMQPTPQTMRVRKLCVVNPTYPPPDQLPWSAEEVKELKKLFSQVQPVTPADLTKLRQVLSDSDVQVFHFSGHGELHPTNADDNKLLLERKQELSAVELSGTKLCAEGHPVVYLNACSVGVTGTVVGRAGGFASNFLDNGCSGVIAPYWPIQDRRSMQFAVALYKKLNLRLSIGEALQQLRQDNPEDPTFYAFAYFGDPWVRLNFQTTP